MRRHGVELRQHSGFSILRSPRAAKLLLPLDILQFFKRLKYARQLLLRRGLRRGEHPAPASPQLGRQRAAEAAEGEEA